MVFQLLTGILSHNDGDGDENIGLKSEFTFSYTYYKLSTANNFNLGRSYKATGVRKENNV